MIVRACTPADAEAIKTLCPESDIDPARDIVVVVEASGAVVGVMAFRQVAFVHSFGVDPGLSTRRNAAELVLAYTLGAGRALGHREALFVVDKTNDAMRNWIEDKGAKEQSGVVYTMEVR